MPDLAGLRVGLVTNDVATTASTPRPLMPVRQALQQAGVNLVALLAPEHGLGASAADGAVIDDAVDRLTGLPVYSLYGATYRPTPELLAGLDLLLFDIPDVGVRYYTYIWTLSYVLEACAASGTPIWILDRPNPLGGDLAQAEGPMLDEANISSFVGRWAIPVRHSLTSGELARFWQAERLPTVDLTVVLVQGWQRAAHWPALGLPFVPTSPAMPSYESALPYPGTCLFEGTNLSDGRGTATPFQIAGAPWLDASGITQQFNAASLPGVVARATQFIPAAHKYAGELCQGIMLHVLDAQTFRPVATGLYLLALLCQHQPQHWQWLPYPTADSGPGHGHFDRLIGRLELRSQLEQSGQPDWATVLQWTALSQWATAVSPYLLYT